MTGHTCLVCNDAGAPGGCLACGRTSMGEAVAAVWRAGQKLLSVALNGRHPTLQVDEFGARVVVDGCLTLAEARGVITTDAIALVVSRAISRGRLAA